MYDWYCSVQDASTCAGAAAIANMLDFDEFQVDDDLEPLARPISTAPSIEEPAGLEQASQPGAPSPNTHSAPSPNNSPTAARDAVPDPPPGGAEEPMEQVQPPTMQEDVDMVALSPAPSMEALDSNEPRHSTADQHTSPARTNVQGIDAARRAAVCNIAAGLRARVAQPALHASRASVEQHSSASVEPPLHTAAEPPVHAPAEVPVQEAVKLPDHIPMEHPPARPSHHLSPPQRPPVPASSNNANNGRKLFAASPSTPAMPRSAGADRAHIP